MDIKNLETFVMVNELRSFTQTAQKLGYTQSTVSFQIKQLEEELGITLFERLNHIVTLTNEGQKLLPIALDIIGLSSQAKQLSGCSTQVDGCVKIAIADSLADLQFRGSFQDFHRSYPGIRLKLISAGSDNMLQLLGQNQVDLVYTLDRRIHHSKCRIEFESPVDVCFVAAAGHPLTQQKKISIDQVLSFPMILTEKNMSYRILLDEALASIGKEAAPLMEVGDTHLICELVRQGLGISFLPEFVAERDVREGRLVRLTVDDMENRIWRQLLVHRNKWISPAIQCVIDYLKA